MNKSNSCQRNRALGHICNLSNIENVEIWLAILNKFKVVVYFHFKAMDKIFYVYCLFLDYFR